MNNKGLDSVKSQFGRSAKSYVTSELHKSGEDLGKLVEIIKTTGDECALDIATGGGHTANALAELVESVFALDITQNMLMEAEKFILGNGHVNVEFIEGNAEQLPFSEGKFDIVTCRIAAHHFLNVDKFVKEVYKVLKPGGHFFLIDNIAPELQTADEFYNKIEKIRDHSHFRAYKKSEWIKRLELEGFEIKEMYQFDKKFNFDNWCGRMNVTDSDKQKLIEFILESSEELKKVFEIVSENRKVVSFQGKSILLKSVKKYQ